jgi:hypothetical protein
VNAESLLHEIAEVFHQHKLEAVMIGNAAAALQGAPVTTLDIDFMIRDDSVVISKLTGVAAALDASLSQPFIPTSSMYRLSNLGRGIQLDFVVQAHGISSFASLRSRAVTVPFGKQTLLIASLDDIIASKKSAARPQDLVVLPILEALKQETRDE